jgi:hypothetical protein
VVSAYTDSKVHFKKEAEPVRDESVLEKLCLATEYEPKTVRDSLNYQFGKIAGYFYFVVENIAKYAM